MIYLKCAGLKVMTSYIFDSSALLAVLNDEPGSKAAMEKSNNITMSSINIAEVMTILVRNGVNKLDAKRILESTVSNIIDFDFEQAITSGCIYTQTKGYGLSLGDRACLSLAKATKMPVLTADKVWAKLANSLEIDFIIIR